MYKKIYCIGGAIVDRKIKTYQPIEFSTSNPASSTTTFGGVAHNVAKNLAQLTDNIFLQCVLGDDTAGKALLSSLQNYAINTDASLILNNKTTAHYYAILHPQGELHLALADIDIYNDIPFVEFTQSWETWQSDSIIFIDANLPEALLGHAIQYCHTNKLTLCIDPVSAPKARRLPSSLHGVFLLKPDRFEAEALTNTRITSTQDCIKAGIILLDKGVKNIVISLGQEGYVVVTENDQKHFPAIATRAIVDVSGAGDAFIAGILFELKRGSTILAACELGAAAAALTLQSPHTACENMTLANLNLLRENQYDPILF